MGHVAWLARDDPLDLLEVRVRCGEIGDDTVAAYHDEAVYDLMGVDTCPQDRTNMEPGMGDW
jgi:hypothetical protein